jgi:hypothetical protein
VQIVILYWTSTTTRLAFWDRKIVVIAGKFSRAIRIMPFTSTKKERKNESME